MNASDTYSFRRLKGNSTNTEKKHNAYKRRNINLKINYTHKSKISKYFGYDHKQKKIILALKENLSFSKDLLKSSSFATFIMHQK